VAVRRRRRGGCRLSGQVVGGRPHGVERNLVVTVYDWLSPKYYIHDLIVTDRRKPTVNPYGLIYGAAELSTDHLPVLDPVKVTKTTMRVPIRDQDAPSSALANPVVAPSPYFGTEQVWDSRVNAHNPMMDQEGRVYWTAQIRSPKNPPAYCAAASGHPSAKVYPLAHVRDGFVQNSRQLTVYDPKSKQFTFIDTCFGTHHLNFGEDADHTLWLSNNLQNEFAIVGWVNTKMFWETGDAAKSQGWTPLVVDTNGNGRRDAWVEPDAPDDPAKDKRIGLGLYGIAYSPADGSIWGSNIGHPGFVIRVQPGSNPSQTALAEVYKVPPPGYGMRGFDVDRQGRAWVTLASGHIASFDRRRCRGRLNGPGAAEGNLCPEGWTFYPIPGPTFAGRDGAAEGPYYTWIDQHDILGLGRDVPIGTGNFSDSLYALTYGKVVHKASVGRRGEAHHMGLTDDRRHHQHRDPDTDALVGRDDRRIAAEHQKFAMREIDDAHHAEDDRQPDADQRQAGDCVKDLDCQESNEIHVHLSQAGSEDRRILRS